MGKQLNNLTGQSLATGVQAVGTIIGGAKGAALTLAGMSLGQLLSYWAARTADAETDWIENRLRSLESTAVRHGNELENIPSLVLNHCVNVMGETDARKHAARRAFLLGRIRAGTSTSRDADLQSEIETWLGSATPLDIQVLMHLVPQTDSARSLFQSKHPWPKELGYPNARDVSIALDADPGLVLRSLKRLAEDDYADGNAREVPMSEMRAHGVPAYFEGTGSGEPLYALSFMGEQAVELLKDYAKELNDLALTTAKSREK